MARLFLQSHLKLARCPHCRIASPLLVLAWQTETVTYADRNKRTWVVYRCTDCGGLVLAASPGGMNHDVVEIYPQPIQVDESVPDPAKTYLSQAIESLHAPSGAIMLAASAVDAMLKNKGHSKGTLNTRIEEAAKKHLITEEMAAWAHDIRLDANDQRHADEAAALPTELDAKKCIDFALALAEFLFVLPARVERGRKEAAPSSSHPSGETSATW